MRDESLSSRQTLQKLLKRPAERADSCERLIDCLFVGGLIVCLFVYVNLKSAIVLLIFFIALVLRFRFGSIFVICICATFVHAGFSPTFPPVHDFFNENIKSFKF